LQEACELLDIVQGGVCAISPIRKQFLEVGEFLEGQASFHLKGVEFDAQKIEGGCWACNFRRLEMQTKLFAKGESPLEGLVNMGSGNIWREDAEEVIEVVTEESGEMVV
jgi:hypothetical protein